MFNVAEIAAPGDDNDVASLIYGTRWAADEDGVTRITYSFEDVGSGEMSDQMKQYVLDAFADIERVANVEFEEVADGGALQFAINANLGSSGYALFPNESGSTVQFLDNQMPEALVLHELLHALGLGHPSGLLASDLRGVENTVMMPTVNQSALGANIYLDPRPTGLQEIDIKALQHIYGGDLAGSRTNTTYVFDTSQTYHETLFDAGGTDLVRVVDEAAVGVEIDLTPGETQDVGTVLGFFTSSQWLDAEISKTVLITEDTWIENVKGGAGDDYIHGNELANRLSGGAGNDTLLGGASSDQLWAGSGDVGDDLFIGGSGADIIGGGAGNDLLIGNDIVESAASGSDTIFGGAGDDVLMGGGWSDANVNQSYDPGEEIGSEQTANSLWGGSGQDTVLGAGGRDIVAGGTGADVLSGLGGSDTIFGGIGDGADTIDGGAGDDLLFGGAGNDKLDGGQGADVLYAGSGDDTVSGGAGADTLGGSPGDDTLQGGAGADHFAFGSVHGHDVITDFDVTEDILLLAGVENPFTDIDALLVRSEETGQGVLIVTGSGSSVLLLGLSLQDLYDAQLELA